VNRLWCALPADERERLEPAVRRLELPAGHLLARAGEPTEWVCFPEGGVASVACRLPDRPPVELATIGNCGVVGIETVLGGRPMAFESSVLIAGGFACLPLAALDSEPLRAAMIRYAHALFVQIGQLSACARLHPIERRLATWLLTVSDRFDRGQLPLTQEQIARALGVRRASVNAVALMLQRAGLITYARGVIRILDRIGLKAAACPCYEVVREAADRAIEPS
jgi:CRP-like cAMP-binding protein